MSTKVLVTGVQGQDGSILAEKLVDQGFNVTGIGRRRLDDHSLRDRKLLSLGKNFEYRICDLRASSVVLDLVSSVRPKVIFNLAAMSSPAESWDSPGNTLQNDTIGFINLLDSVRLLCPDSRVVQACTAAIYQSSTYPIDEDSIIKISNPYAAAKYSAFTISQLYKSKYNLRISNAIMFNHESIWRPEAFVTRKISKGVARIANGLQDKLNLWSLTPVRDWGWAPEFMDAFTKIGMLDKSHDLILATGVGATIEDFVNYAFSCAGLNPNEYLEQTTEPFSTDVDISVGNPARAEKFLDWKARVTWKEVVEQMVNYDLQQISSRR